MTIIRCGNLSSCSFINLQEFGWHVTFIHFQCSGIVEKHEVFDDVEEFWRKVVNSFVDGTRGWERL